MAGSGQIVAQGPAELQWQHPRYQGGPCFGGDDVSQGPSKTLKVDLHDVAGRQAQVIAEAESTGAIEMDMDIARPPVHGKLEVMMLNVFERVAHVRLAASDRFFPKQRAFAVDTSTAGHRIEIGIKDQFGPD